MSSMHSIKIQSNEMVVPTEVQKNWQQIVDLLAELFNVPASLIMRVHVDTIEVFISSNSPKNPYERGENTNLPGLYCTHVMQNRQQLLVTDATKDPNWDKNPDIEIGMISYLGFPLEWPNGEIFGTICVLDSQENSYSPELIRLLEQFRKMTENHLKLIMKNQELYDANKKIVQLEEFVTRCSYCGKIKSESNQWVQVDIYLRDDQQKNVSHGACPTCSQILLKNARID